MKYCNKYPDLDPPNTDKIESNIMRCYLYGACAICGTPTNFADIDYQCYVCSDECMEKLNEKYGVTPEQRR